MKSRLFKHIYSTTLVTSLLTGGVHLAQAAPLVATSEQTDDSPLSLDFAIEQALKNSIDFELLRLELDITKYETSIILREKEGIKKADIMTLADAKKKFEDAAKAIKEVIVDEVALNTQKNNIQLQVQKAFFEVQSLEAKIKAQKKSLQRQYWLDSQETEAHKNLATLEASYKQALAKLNDLLNEKADKKWKIVTTDLTQHELLSLEQLQAKAYEKRPEMIKAQAEIDFTQVRIDYTAEYTALSTHKGIIARNEHKKAELQKQKTQKKIGQEVSDNYTKALAAQKALGENTTKKETAWERYQATLDQYRLGKASMKELMEVEANLFESETKAIESIYQYNLAATTLNQSTGY
ncbi:TolC family protein [Brevibacillus antibioticus]|uniref:TolC family protein n=1 Tax=Brevibacillus antibioticus TaxID=2570228 RepID=A0A4V5TIY0_9BACL|nr:TolC family protein [Brevibacillus antibioticus]TKI57063.1 TolC family protein [Brevibacillus antibioticus]